MIEPVVGLITILIAAICSCALIAITRNVKFSVLAVPLIIECFVMLYSYINYGAISQFGFLPYFIALPFLLIGSGVGAIFWLYIFGKGSHKKGEMDE